MHIKTWLFIVTFFLFLPVGKPHAQTNGEDLPGLQFACLQADACASSNLCTTNHVHRVLLTPHAKFKAAINDQRAYIAECLQVVNPAKSTPDTICTTGSSALDIELFCGPDVDDPSVCDFFSQLQQRVHYSLSQETTDGIYLFDNASKQFVKTDPTTIQTDSQGNIVPAKIEWQSASDMAERRFIVLNKITQQADLPQSTDPGQKQGTLTFPTLSEMCDGVTYDPEGIVFDTQTGMPIAGVHLQLNYAATATDTFAPATSGLDDVLPPGTNNPLVSSLSGFYQFFGKNGYYTIVPQHASYNHAPAATTIPAAVTSLYPSQLLYFSDSNPIQEKGVKQTRHIPLVASAAVPQPAFQVISNLIQKQITGEVFIKGRVNAPATLIVEICSILSGIENCHDKKMLDPAHGGPAPANNFSYAVSRNQNELTTGEYYKVSFTPWSVSQPLSLFAPGVVHAQDNTISFTVEPIPSYIEGYAYDEAGNVIPHATVGVYVSFSPTAYRQVRTDAQGHFRFASDALPSMPFVIKYTKPDKTQMSVSTTQFLAQNKEFMEVEKINPYHYVTTAQDPRRNITPGFVPRQETPATQVSSVPAVQDVSPVTTEPPSKQSAGTSTLITAILLLIAGTLGLFAVVYVVIKRSHRPME